MNFFCHTPVRFLGHWCPFEFTGVYYFKSQFCVPYSPLSTECISLQVPQLPTTLQPASQPVTPSFFLHTYLVNVNLLPVFPSKSLNVLGLKNMIGHHSQVYIRPIRICLNRYMEWNHLVIFFTFAFYPLKIPSEIFRHYCSGGSSSRSRDWSTGDFHRFYLWYISLFLRMAPTRENIYWTGNYAWDYNIKSQWGMEITRRWISEIFFEGGGDLLDKTKIHRNIIWFSFCFTGENVACGEYVGGTINVNTICTFCLKRLLMWSLLFQINFVGYLPHQQEIKRWKVY